MLCFRTFTVNRYPERGVAQGQARSEGGLNDTRIVDGYPVIPGRAAATFMFISGTYISKSDLLCVGLCAFEHRPLYLFYEHYQRYV